LLDPPPARPRLAGLTGTLSDPHRQGRSVFRLTFVDAAGDARPSPAPSSVFYKPRSLKADAQFQAVLAACNEESREGALALRGLRYADHGGRGEAFPEFRLLGVLDCGDHGWVEAIAPGPCVTVEEARRFYLRQGGFLALLHVLAGADMHAENVIACGEHPMLVDLEMLLHPPVEAAPAATGRARADAR